MFSSLHLYAKRQNKINKQSINKQISDPENTLLDPVILTRPSLLYSYIWFIPSPCRNNSGFCRSSKRYLFIEPN